MVSARSAGPLRLLTPRNHGDAAWVFQSSYGGGYVGEDALGLELRVERDSTLFLSSQASTKVYRATQASFELRARVESGAALIAWPDPISCFPGASFEQRQAFTLDDGASLLVVDAITAGRVAREERWSFTRCASRITVDLGGVRRLHDALELDSRHGALAARLAAADAMATVVLCGPRFEAAGAELVKYLGSHPLQPLGAAPLWVASPWPWGIVLRVAGRSIEGLQASLRERLGPCVRELLGDDPLARKW